MTQPITALMGDADTITGTTIRIAPDDTEDSPSITVNAYRADDGATVVFLDTAGGIDRVRINVNDGCVFDEGVETGTRYRISDRLTADARTPEQIAQQQLAALDLGHDIPPCWAALAAAIRSGWLDAEDLHRLVTAAAQEGQRTPAIDEIPEQV